MHGYGGHLAYGFLVNYLYRIKNCRLLIVD